MPAADAPEELALPGRGFAAIEREDFIRADGDTLSAADARLGINCRPSFSLRLKPMTCS
jgi:hypothetical protein